MDKITERPDYIFESSWEVCNKVGGIYTVLSTKACTLQKDFPDKILFIGPDWKDKEDLDFIEDSGLLPGWKAFAEKNCRLKLRIGRWDVAGKPLVALVDYSPLLAKSDQLFYQMWEQYGVDSLNAYGDYTESCTFAYATGKVIESYYRFFELENRKVVALFNEWMLGMGALYVRRYLPEVATLFTTHATTVGRSIAGNGKPLYSCMASYNGDLMAKELNVGAKHSLEKQAARYADCFTTVSDITAAECKQLLGKAPDVVTPNGFERNFVPTGDEYGRKREEARAILINVAEKLTGCPIPRDAFLVSTSGRYEYRNKGIDVFIDALDLLRRSEELKREVVAFLMIPAWTLDARSDLKYMLANGITQDVPLQVPYTTHWLNDMADERILNYILSKGFGTSGKVKVVFAPCYLTGSDGIFNKTYYDLLTGMDLTAYPSYYEPWGYTPLESIAFGIPAVTTDLAGFGLWARKEGAGEDIRRGVRVVKRTDDNYFDVAQAIAQTVITLCAESKSRPETVAKRCRELSDKAGWDKFITSYYEAYSIALQHAAERLQEKDNFRDHPGMAPSAEQHIIITS